MNPIAHLKANYGKYLCKAAGIGALALVAYDAHVMGKIQADTRAKAKDADACLDTFNNTQYLSSPSTVVSKAKNGVHHFEMDHNYRNFFNSAIGYFKGFISTTVNKVIPFALGLGALFGKGKWAKGSAIGLGAYAGLVFFKDVLGMGHHNELNKPYR